MKDIKELKEDSEHSDCYFRIVYRIVGRLRFLSHKELMRVMIRAFRRARLPLAYSRGYHPHPLISFGPPLSVGMAGTAELLDVRLIESRPPEQIAEAVARQMPPGIMVTEVLPLEAGAGAIHAQVRTAGYAFTWPAMSPAAGAAIPELLSRGDVMITRATAKRTRTLDIRPGIYDMTEEPPDCRLQLALSPALHVRPQEVIAAMTGWTDDQIQRIVITRTGFTGTGPFPGSTPNTYGTTDYH